MNPFRQVAKDTASLLQDLRRGFRYAAWRLAWWGRKRQIERREQEAEAENLRRGVRAASKMCRQCRALISASAATCPECGAATADIVSGGLRRWAEQSLPFDPSVSAALISVYFLLFVVAVVQTAGMPVQGGDAPGLVGAIMNLNGRVLVMLGANVGPLSAGPQPWRLLTAIFLHAGLIHLAFNSMALRAIGPLIDQVYGARLMFLLYLFTGVAGNVVSLWWHGLQLLQVGASGAIFGLIGVAAVYGYRRRDTMGEMLRKQMVQWAVYGVMMGFFFRADNAAHIGGFLAGAAAAAVLPDPKRIARPALERVWGYLAAAGVLAAVGSFALLAAGVALPV